jgi:polar amino acid transport system substrate-binding protein
VEPNYYAGGVTVFLRPEQRMTDWQALRGQKICATQGAYFNRPMSQRYLLDLQMYRSIRDALLALRDGRCVGYLYSSAAVQAYLKKPEWAGYKMPLPQAMLAPWAINISRNETETELDVWLGNVIADWHRSGFLIEREKAWGIQETRFLKDAQARWGERDDKGGFVCDRDVNGLWPVQCRNSTFVRSTEVEGLQKIGLWIKENAGMNLTLVFDPYDRALFLKGVLYSLVLTGGCIALSMALGAAGALVAESRFTRLGTMVRGVAVWGRMTPPLLWMYLLFFGVGAWLWTAAGVRLSPFWVALWCMSFYTAASVMNTVLESAMHIRNDRPGFQLSYANFRSVVEFSAGPVKAALINVVKQSVMASAIAVPELISATTAIMSDQGNVGVMMNAFLISFLLLISLWMRLIDWVESRLRVKQGEAE